MKLETHHISLGHKQALVNNVSVSIQPGMCISLMGVNGSGKSTLLRTLTGLQFPLAGNITLDGNDIFKLPVRNRSSKFSLVRPQTEFPGLCTVEDFVLSGAIASMNWTGLHSGADKIASDEYLSLTGVSHLKTRYMSSLSDGEKQKASIARALMANTPFIFLDEPVSFLDIPARKEIMKLVQQLALGGKAVVYSTHDMDTSIIYSTHMWLIKENTLLAGTTSEMSPLVHSYFHS